MKKRRVWKTSDIKINIRSFKNENPQSTTQKNLGMSKFFNDVASIVDSLRQIVFIKMQTTC